MVKKKKRMFQKIPKLATNSHSVYPTLQTHIRVANSVSKQIRLYSTGKIYSLKLIAYNTSKI